MSNLDSQPVPLHRKVVYISRYLMQVILTEGWHADVECIQGLPNTARYIRMVYDMERDLVGMVIEDDSFPPAIEGQPLETIKPAYKQYHHE